MQPVLDRMGETFGKMTVVKGPKMIVMLVVLLFFLKAIDMMIVMVAVLLFILKAIDKMIVMVAPIFFNREVLTAWAS